MEVASRDDFIFSLDWNSAGVLAIGNSTKTVFIKKFEPANKSFSDLKTFALQSPCRCLSWNPIVPALLACGTFDGRIVVYDTERGEVTQQLQGTNSRIVCLQWHP